MPCLDFVREAPFFPAINLLRGPTVGPLCEPGTRYLEALKSSKLKLDTVLGMTFTRSNKTVEYLTYRVTTPKRVTNIGTFVHVHVLRTYLVPTSYRYLTQNIPANDTNY